MVFDGQADVWTLSTGRAGVLGIGRYKDGEKLAALFNFTAEEQTVLLAEEGDFTDLLRGQRQDKTAVTLPAGGFRWLLCDFEKEK